MARRQDVLDYVIITAIALLIFGWAAEETRTSRKIWVEVGVVDDDPVTTWQLTQDIERVHVTVEGSTRAIRKAQEINELRVSPTEYVIGSEAIDVLARLREDRAFIDTGVSILSVDPNTMTLEKDKIVQDDADVRVDLGDVMTTDAPVVQPAQVQVTMPNKLREKLFRGGSVWVEPDIDPEELARLEPDRMHTLENVVLRMRDAQGVAIRPRTVTVSFTIRSSLRELTLASVRVQVAGPPDPEYIIELEPNFLRDVVVKVDEALARLIESEEAPVFALVYLKSLEKDQGLTKKKISQFFALRPDGTMVEVAYAQVGDATTWPEIGLKITPRPASE